MSVNRLFRNPQSLPDGSQPYPVQRPTALSGITGTCWSKVPTGAYIHWWHGRTCPCPLDDTCEACKVGVEYRYESYVWLERSVTERVVILALPYRASLYLRELIEKSGSLYGRSMEVIRAGKTNRSQIRLSVLGPDQEEGVGPTLPSLKATMCRIWGVRNE